MKITRLISSNQTVSYRLNKYALRIVICVLILGAGKAFGGVAASAKPAPADSLPAAPRKLTDDGLAALAAGKLAPAQQKLEQAYVDWPSSEGLYLLGRVAQAQGRSVAAADLYRRYLAQAERDSDEQLRITLTQYVASIQVPTSEVEVVTEDAGALLRMDGAVVGTLPLSDALLVGAGAHRFTLEKGSQRFQTSPQSLPVGQRAQLQMTLESRYAVLTLTPALVLLIEPAALNAEQQQQLFAVVGTAARSERTFLISREQTNTAIAKSVSSRRRGCAGDLPCEQKLARLVDAASVLSITVKSPALEQGSSPLSIRLLDIPTGAVLGSTTPLCVSCSMTEVKDAVLKETQKLLQESASRGRGTLQVAGAVDGAKVSVDGRELGVTPLLRESFEGQHEIVVERAGYLPYRTYTRVTRGQTSSVDVFLQPGSIFTPTVGRRPRGRLIAGGITIAAGLVLAAIGASELAHNSGCLDTSRAAMGMCNSTYAAQKTGGALIGASAFVIVGGILVMAWPAK